MSTETIIDVEDIKNEDEIIPVPVMETDFNELFKIIKLVNVVDSINLVSLPNHVSYYCNENTSLETTIKEILSYYNSENDFWRIKESKIQPVGIEDDTIRFADKVLYDASKVIIISKLNSIFIFPGERSIKDGGCSANEVIRLINLIATKSFLMQFNDIEDENTKENKLHVNFIPIEENIKNNLENSNESKASE